MLPVIERLSLYPAETLLAMPMAPEDAVRGAIVLAGITHAIAEDAAQLRAQQTEVAGLRARLDAAMPALEQAEAEQRDRAAALDAALEASRQTRADAEDAAADAARRAAEDAARADSLRTALDRIEADRRLAEARAREQAAAADRKRQQAAAADARARQEALARPAGPGVGEPHGQLTSPVAGSIVRSFGRTPARARRAGSPSRHRPARASSRPAAGGWPSPGRSAATVCWSSSIAAAGGISCWPGSTGSTQRPAGRSPRASQWAPWPPGIRAVPRRHGRACISNYADMANR